MYSQTNNFHQNLKASMQNLCNQKKYWGVGIDADIIKASIAALEVAVNKIEEIKSAGATVVQQETLLPILQQNLK